MIDGGEIGLPGPGNTGGGVGVEKIPLRGPGKLGMLDDGRNVLTDIGGSIVNEVIGSSITFIFRDCIEEPGGGGNKGAGDAVFVRAGMVDIVTFVAPSFATEGLT